MPVCICVFVCLYPSCLVYFRTGWRWVGTLCNHQLLNECIEVHTRTHRLAHRADKADLSEQMSRQQSSQRAAEEEYNPCWRFPLHIIWALCAYGYSYQQQRCQKGNQSINKSRCKAAQSSVCVLSGWLYRWWSTSSPWWWPQIVRKSCMMFFLQFLVLIKTKTTLFAFVVWKMHLIPWLLNLCSCNLVC